MTALLPHQKPIHLNLHVASISKRNSKNLYLHFLKNKIARYAVLIKHFAKGSEGRAT